MLLEGSDACFAPVLTMGEARAHPHNRARNMFVEVAGVEQPGPAPRFSRTPASVQRPASKPAADTNAVLADWGFSPADIAACATRSGVLAASEARSEAKRAKSAWWPPSGQLFESAFW